MMKLTYKTAFGMQHPHFTSSSSSSSSFYHHFLLMKAGSPLLWMPLLPFWYEQFSYHMF